MDATASGCTKHGARAAGILPFRAMTSTLDSLYAAAVKPSRLFGPVPFWFWNDDLDREELLRQLRIFREAGCGGVIPHARVGLSRRIGYLTDTFLGLIRDVVAEASHLDMRIILYDEGSYPSGSASGAVAAHNPDYVSQAIGLWEHEIKGPSRGYWRPNTGRALRDRHVATVAARCVGDGDAVDAESVRLLPASPHDVIPYDLPGGRWRLLSVWNTDSGGHIRGAFAEQESGSAMAPAAGDILNPEAVDCFLRLTHERYREFVGDYFGETVIAMFTDEPSVFGKSPKRPTSPQPFTPGFVDWLTQRWGEDPRTWLPALWVDYGPQTEAFRQRYRHAVEERLHEVFYAAQSRWCAANGLALTGHPAASNDMASLSTFQLPGQDMVWRYVTPDSASALEGVHSVAPKAATSGARRAGARRSLAELCGAYGWRLSLDEVKWLFDWHLVRGNNLLNPHAFFYSIDGRRAWESEPDLGLHNVWWPHISHLLRYAGRISGLLADAESVCHIAILGDDKYLPWRAAGALLQQQRDFAYLAIDDLLTGRLQNGRLLVGGAGYRAVVVDGVVGGEPGPLAARLDELMAAGVVVVRTWGDGDDLGTQLHAVPANVTLSPANDSLRVCHLRRGGRDLFYVVNEGEEEIEATMGLPAFGAVEAWDLVQQLRTPVSATAAGDGVEIPLRLPRRESLVFAVDPTGRPLETARDLEPAQIIDISDDLWSVYAQDGACHEELGLGDWSQHDGCALFSGTLSYRASVNMPAGTFALDLGRVGDIAECSLDGAVVGVSLWAPHLIPLPCIGEGEHELEIHVTNSMANEYEGAQLPSGLFGPVRFLITPTPRKDQIS